MGYGDDSAQFVSLWPRDDVYFPFTGIHVRVDLNTQEYAEVHYMQTLLWFPKVAVFPPPGSSVYVCECLAEVWF